jgi:Zn-dependent peptidase ImmA (M78 family)
MRLSKYEKLDLKLKASKFRETNGLSANSSISLRSIIIKHNILTISKPLDQVSGMAIKANDLKFILFNSNHIYSRSRFTVAHELYHLFIQDNFDSAKCNTGLHEKQSDREETNADYFAASLLMPDDGVLELIPEPERRKNKVSDATLFRIHQYYKVSVNAAIFKLIELGLADGSYYTKYDSKKALALNLGYDDTLFKPMEPNRHIGDYGIIANDLYNKGLISESFYFELMNAINIDPFDKDEEHR